MKRTPPKKKKTFGRIEAIGNRRHVHVCASARPSARSAPRCTRTDDIQHCHTADTRSERPRTRLVGRVFISADISPTSFRAKHKCTWFHTTRNQPVLRTPHGPLARTPHKLSSSDRENNTSVAVASSDAVQLFPVLSELVQVIAWGLGSIFGGGSFNSSTCVRNNVCVLLCRFKSFRALSVFILRACEAMTLLAILFTKPFHLPHKLLSWNMPLATQLCNKRTVQFSLKDTAFVPKATAKSN